MEKNEFLLFNEIIYRMNTTVDLEDLRRALLVQLRLLIPFAAASIITIEMDPTTHLLTHRDPLCLPERFVLMEQEWIAKSDEDRALWHSHAPESVIVRDSEMWEREEERLSSPSYRDVYSRYGIYDVLQMNIAYQNERMALLTLYRTREDGPFTDRDVFFLRALSNHIDLAYHARLHGAAAARPEPTEPLRALAARCGLTRREEEIVGLIFRDRSNEEILDTLYIARNTLMKHLQNIYRKCGVSSRWELRKLRGS